MSAKVKVSGKLPGDDEINGLDAEHDDLLADPKAIRAAIIWYDVREYSHKIATGDDVPLIELRRFEPLGRLDDVPDVVRDLVLKAAQRRTGKTPLPFDQTEPGAPTPVED